MKDVLVETQGIIIWARSGSSAVILWCADSGGLVYVADRRLVGDRHEALTVGDFVDFRVETMGAMRVGYDLRYRATGAEWVSQELGRDRDAPKTPVMSASGKIARLVHMGSDAVSDLVTAPAANGPRRDGPGAA